MQLKPFISPGSSLGQRCTARYNIVQHGIGDADAYWVTIHAITVQARTTTVLLEYVIQGMRALAKFTTPTGLSAFEASFERASIMALDLIVSLNLDDVDRQAILRHIQIQTPYDINKITGGVSRQVRPGYSRIHDELINQVEAAGMRAEAEILELQATLESYMCQHNAIYAGTTSLFQGRRAPGLPERLRRLLPVRQMQDAMRDTLKPQWRKWSGALKQLDKLQESLNDAKTQLSMQIRSGSSSEATSSSGHSRPSMADKSQSSRRNVIPSSEVEAAQSSSMSGNERRSCSTTGSQGKNPTVPTRSQSSEASLRASIPGISGPGAQVTGGESSTQARVDSSHSSTATSRNSSPAVQTPSRSRSPAGSLRAPVPKPSSPVAQGTKSAPKMQPLVASAASSNASTSSRNTSPGVQKTPDGSQNSAASSRGTILVASSPVVPGTQDESRKLGRNKFPALRPSSRSSSPKHNASQAGQSA